MKDIMKAKIEILFGISLACVSSFALADVVEPWMNPEVGDAWTQGYKGQNVTIKVIDYFNSYLSPGDLGLGPQVQAHGAWTMQEANMIAPSATMISQEISTRTAVNLNHGLNVLNLSYTAPSSGYTASQYPWSERDKSIINYAQKGSAIVSKAAGNFPIAVGTPNLFGDIDYLNLALKGTKSAILVGALNSNGTTASPATMASYSTFAGADSVVQKQFLVVGVTGDTTGLYGTSFAAPIISGYAAILGSKFTHAKPAQITNQLLNTARQDTVLNYDPSVYGRGEASLTRALAPVSIR